MIKKSDRAVVKANQDAGMLGMIEVLQDDVLSRSINLDIVNPEFTRFSEYTTRA